MPLGNPIRKQNESRIISVLATEGQTVFTVEGGYIINQISVFRNGVRLSNSEDFTAGDGSTVTLNNAANIDDRIEFQIFDRFTVQNAIIGAASSQTINGDLVLTGKLFGTGDFSRITTGVVTATQLDLNGSLDVSSTSVFNDDVTFTGASENVTFDKSVDSLIFNDGAKAIFGTSSDMHITHNGTLSQIANGTNQLEIISNDLDLRSSTGDEHYFTARVGGAATVFYDNSVRLETTPSGADVTGTLNVTGISTLQAITATTGTFTGTAAQLELVGNEGVSAALRLTADQGDDNGDGWEIRSNQDNNDLTISNNTTGSYVDKFTLLKTGELTLTSDLTIPDKILHAGEANTAIRFPANDTFTVETAGSERFRIASDGKIGMGGATGPEEVLDLGNAVQINLKVGGRAYLGQGYSTAATILGHSVKAKTTGTVSGGMEVTETNSGGGAPSAMRMQSGNIEFHTAASGTSGATFDSEKLRITSDGKVGVGVNPTNYPGKFVVSGDALICDRDIHSRVANSVANSDRGFKQDVDGTEKLHLYADNSNNIILEGNSGSEKLRIASDGSLTSTADNNGQVIHKFYNKNGTASSSAMTVEHHFNFNRSNGQMNLSGARIVAGKEREWVGAASNQDGFLAFYTTSNETPSEKLRITSGGRVLIGTNSDSGHGFGYSWNPKLQFESASTSDYARFSLIYNGNDAVGPGILFGKSRGTSIGSNTLVTNGDQLGGLFFQAADGTDKNSRAATIICYADGGTGGNDTPGSLEFSTTSNGASDTTARMIIDSSGRVRIGQDEQGGTLSGLQYRTKISSESGQTYSLILGERGGQGMLIACRLDGAGSNTTAIRFADGPGASSTAGITVNNTTVTYGTGSSDRTMKKNFENWTETVLTKFKNLNPQKFNYKVEEDGTEKTKGYIAQDLVEDFPEAYPKDPETEKYSFNPSGMVVYLMKALQEATTKIETLEAKVTALEGS